MTPKIKLTEHKNKCDEADESSQLNLAKMNEQTGFVELFEVKSLLL